MDQIAAIEPQAAGRVRRGLRIAQLPKAVLCVPLVAQWLWLSARYRSLTLPSALNPAIETGGLAGESKSACLAQIGADHAGHVADWRVVRPGDDPVRLQLAAGLGFPLVAKPDIGWCGYGVRRVEDEAGLAAYAAAFPRTASFIIQRFIAAPNEAGLFYARVPGEAAGRLLAMTFRFPPHVTGDGASPLSTLAARAGQPLPPSAQGTRVPRPGEFVPLATVASLRVGARYEDASALVTEALAARVDAIARSMPDFHLGRFDARFDSVAELRRGRFHILEVNGAGAEAIHLWDRSVSLRAAFEGIFAKQRMLFALGARARAMGHAPVGLPALARAWANQQRLIALYPPSN